jgi:thiol-disulfide isomerase/thioredoxin
VAGPDAGLTDVEILLKVRDAERAFDEAVSAATKPESTRLNPILDPEKKSSLVEATSSLLAAYDKMLASDGVTQLRKGQVRIKKVSFLYEAVRIDPQTFQPARDAYLREVYEEARKEDGEDRRFAALLAAYKLKEDFIDTNKPKEKVQAALEEFQREFPRTLITEQLYVARAENLVEAGDIAGAIEIYRKVIEDFKSDPRTAILDSTVKRLELIGQPAELVGPTLDGIEYNITDSKGTVVLIDFWASWCGPCMNNFERLNRLYTKYHDKGFTIVGVSLDDKREDVDAALQRHSVPWTHVFFPPAEGVGRSFDNPAAAKLNVNYLPSMMLVDKEGKFIGTDYPRMDVLEWQIAKAVGLDAPIPDPPPADAPPADVPPAEVPPADAPAVPEAQ